MPNSLPRVQIINLKLHIVGRVFWYHVRAYIDAKNLHKTTNQSKVFSFQPPILDNIGVEPCSSCLARSNAARVLERQKTWQVTSHFSIVGCWIENDTELLSFFETAYSSSSSPKKRPPGNTWKTYLRIRVLCSDFHRPVSSTTATIKDSSWGPDGREYKTPVEETAEDSMHHLKTRNFVLERYVIFC
jgi:hypothetical protein